MEFVENKGISMAGGLHLSHEWGRRAEDPFRGLRAGPVRFSPITFAAESHRATPQHPGNLKKSAKVCLLVVSRSENFFLSEDGWPGTRIGRGRVPQALVSKTWVFAVSFFSQTSICTRTF